MQYLGARGMCKPEEESRDKTKKFPIISIDNLAEEPEYSRGNRGSYSEKNVRNENRLPRFF